MRGLAKLLILAAALVVPAAAWAHCCCDHPGKAHHHARKMRSHHYVERGWYETRRTVVTNRRCNNFPRVAMGTSGVTWLDIRVGDDGWTRSVRIRRSSGHAGLDRASVACARGWYFRHGPVWQQARVEWWVGRPG